MVFVIIIITLLLSAFFSGIEIAFFSANRLKIEIKNKQGLRSGKYLSEFIKKPSHFLGTTLFGNNIALVVFNLLAAKAIEPWLVQLLPMDFQSEIWVLLIQTLIFTALILIFGEFLPKLLFRINPSGVLTFFATPFYFIYKLFTPLVLFTTWCSKLILKLFGVNLDNDKPIFSKMELDSFVKYSQENADEDSEIDTEMFEKALYLPEIKVRECMVPRTEIEAIEIGSTVKELKQMFLDTGHSKIVIYGENIDDIKGYIHHFELWKKPEELFPIISEIPIIPETMSADDMLSTFIKDGKTIAWVVDEFGGTAGIITLEDILEEIFGEIADEHDQEEFVERQISENEYLFSGRLEVDYINDKYKLNIPEGEYETLAGFVMAEIERIPVNEETFSIRDFNFEILYATDTLIQTIKLTYDPKESEEDEED